MSVTTVGILNVLRQSLNMVPTMQDLAQVATRFPVSVVGGETATIEWLGQIPGFREKGVKGQGADLTPQKIDLKVRDFRSSWRLKGATVRNSQVGPILEQKRGDWGRRRLDLMNQLVADLINAGETALAYDGESFFDTDHVVDGSGTLNNDITSPAVAPSAPTYLELSQAVLNGLTQFMSFKDNQGLPLYKQMTSIDVMVNTAMVGKVAAAVGLAQIDSGAGSVDNPILGLLKSMGITLTVKTSPSITLGNTKIVLINRSPGCTPILIGENPAEQRVTELDEGSDFFKREDMYEFNAFYAGGATYGEFLDAVLVTLV